MFRNNLVRLNKSLKKESRSLFAKIRSANQRMEDAKSQADILPLIGEVWKRGELHILFSDPGVGKSILAVSIADALSRGIDFMFLQNKIEAQKVLFYDFELSDKQFEKRYSDELTTETFGFSENLFIDNVDWFDLKEAYPDLSFEELIFNKIEADLDETQATVLIIDNLTFLQTQATDKTGVALDLMRRLMKLKRDKEISILILAHTPKRPPNEPISMNHLAGSRQIPNFADSVSAIAKSIQGSAKRYWKQIKPSRSGEMLYDSDNVIVCSLEKKDHVFLTFKHEGFDYENQHLYRKSKEDKDELKKKAKELKDKGMVIREIAEAINVPKSTVDRWLKEE